MTTGPFAGAALVARQELRIRLRTGRWRWLLASWLVVVLLFTGLLKAALVTGEAERPHGVSMFGTLMLFVLALALLISPALAAQSINGDRERGTLATLQVTQLSPLEIALGKLAAAWVVGLVALGLTVPCVVWSVAEGGVGLVRPFVVMGLVALLIGVVCAVSQALSALLARSITSALMSYLAVFALTVGTLIAFGLVVPLTSEKVYEEHRGGSYEIDQTREDRVWWLLAPNPFVVLADAAPQQPPSFDPVTGDYVPQPFDPLGEIGRSVREIRLPPWERSYYVAPEPPPVWPYGLGFNLALGGAALYITTRRLRTPSRTLPRGIRIA